MTKQLKEIEIPFGTKDNEFCGWKYTIPEGMEATIVDNKIVVKKKKSEDESIREALIKGLRAMKVSFHTISSIKIDDAIAWLEKQVQKPQGKSALEAAREEKVDNANKIEPKDHSSIDPHFWKSIDKIEPKFHEGEWVVQGRNILRIRYVGNEYYCCETAGGYVDSMLISEIDSLYHLWTLQDAKPGDVLACKNGWTCIFKTLVNDETFSSYCFMDNTKWFCETGSECHTLKEEFVKAYNGKIYPATKEQSDQFEKAMVSAGYKWNKKERKLEKIKQDPWSEEDERMYRGLHNLIYSTPYCDSRKELSDWIKSIKDVIQTQPKQEWKQENIGDLDGFEIVMMQIGSSFFGKNAGLGPNDTNAIKEQANILLGLVQKQEWSKEDEYLLNETIQHLKQLIAIDKAKHCACDVQYYQRDIDWLKSLRPQNKWKPSDEQMNMLKIAVSTSNSIVLDSLYNDLKILKGE